MTLDTAIDNAIASNNERELALGFVRYEALRKLSPNQYADLTSRNLHGERWDDLVDELIVNRGFKPQKENK